MAAISTRPDPGAGPSTRGLTNTWLAVLDRRAFVAGKDVFREGQEGRSAYIVESGTVEIWKSVGGERVVLALLGRGAVFGEMALIDLAPRMATATALEHTICVVIPEPLLRTRLAAADPVVRALIRILVRNVRAMSSSGPAEADDEPLG
jgi:CRP-like cAMP-binding protein